MPDVELSTALQTLATVSVATGAAPIDLDIPASASRVNVSVTTGGTGGVEVLNLPALTGMINAGLVVFVGIAVQTDPADVVQITVDGSEVVPQYLAGGAVVSPAFATIKLSADNSEQAVGFIWGYDTWYCDPNQTDWEFDYTNTSPDVTAQAYGPGGSFSISGRSGNSGDENGGDVHLGLGLKSGAGRDGTVIIDGPGLPSVDLDVAQGLYYDPVTFVVKYHP